MNTLELAQKLFYRGEKMHTIGGYFGILSIFAFAQTAKDTGDEKIINEATTRLRNFPENYGPFKYNFTNYLIGGLGKAWAVMEGLMDEPLLREYAEKTMTAPADRDGIMCKPQYLEKEQVWIDAVFAVTPFMLYSGIALNEDKYIDFAFEQCKKMYDLLLDKKCGLLHQARGFMDDIHAITEDHWSRGNGWCYLGLTELVKYLPSDSPHRPEAVKMFKDLSENLLPYQTPKGLWRQEIPCELSWIESSGTALFIYGFGIGLRLGILDKDKFETPFKKGVEGLGRYCIGKELSTKMCCQGCLCPGEGARKGTVSAYLTDVFPCQDERHSFGAFVLAMLEAHRNGIMEVELSNAI